METLTAEQYKELCSNAEIVQKDAYGPKVLRLADGQMVKIFRRKSFFSSALFRPYAGRFRKNAYRLSELGIRTVRVNRLCRCPSPARHLVFYQPVRGITLRDFLTENPANVSILEDFAAYLAELHAKGIYFRSIHFGNVIVLPDSAGFALIDVADLSFRPAPLDFKLSLRNFRHFLRYREDCTSLETFGPARFVSVFARNAGLSAQQRSFLESRIIAALNH
jgi:hypothetical protein